MMEPSDPVIRWLEKRAELNDSKIIELDKMQECRHPQLKNRRRLQEIKLC